MSRKALDELLILCLRTSRPKRQEGGYIIVVVMGVLLVLSGLFLTMALTSKVDTASGKASEDGAAGFYAAEAGLNLRAKQIKNKFLGYNQPQGTSPDKDGNPATPPTIDEWKACVKNVGTQGTGDFACDNSQVIQGQQISSFILDANPKDAFGNTIASSITIGPDEQFAGLNAQEYRYDVTSVAIKKTDTVSNLEAPTSVLQMRFKSRLVPLFQFAAFYDKDLEILPGPNMFLSGPVHSNGDLYLNSGANLRIDGTVSTVGNLYRGRKNEGNGCSGGVFPFDGFGLTTGMNCSGGNRTQITDVSPWNGKIRLGMDRLTVPPPETLDPTPGAIYWDKADLRLVLKLNNSNNPTGIEVRTANGTVDTGRTNTLNSCAAVSTTLRGKTASNNNYTATDVDLKVDSVSGFNVGDRIIVGDDLDSNVIRSINTSTNTITLRRQLGHSYQPTNVARKGDTVRKAIVATSDTFFNYRENKEIRMMDVDVRGLLDCAHQNDILTSSNNVGARVGIDDTTEGGLVWHVTVDGPDKNRDVTKSSSDGNNYGIRFYNGGSLSSTVSGAPQLKGLTIVSDQAVYTQGDYNCAWDNSANTCTLKKPASFLVDSLNVLSNSWPMDDSHSRNYGSNNLPSGNLGAQAASETRVNAAFLSGTDTTGGQEGSGGQGGYYNGGLENYPRFHENWSGRKLIYRGSFVSLNRARRVDGRWGNQRYSAPIREWDFDVDFRNAANLPPLSPRFVYLRQERFSRGFKQSSLLRAPSPFAILPLAQSFATLPMGINFSY